MCGKPPWRASILVSALMISSAMPSQKYSFSVRGLMLTNGSTAIDFAAARGHLVGARPA